MSKLTIVMYHYVRDLNHSRYPEIKGLETELFIQQLRYFQKYYQVVRMEDVIEYLKKGKTIPDNSLLLTFDDGYTDHYENVFPILNDLGLQGSFFPPVRTVKDHKVLDVNKIHFILASIRDKNRIIDDLFTELDQVRDEYSLKSNQHYFDTFAEESRFDTKEVVFIKNMLQRELPEELRNHITDVFFKKYVYPDESVFSRELYMSVDQLKCMKRKGMFIGSHGTDHYWLNTLPPEKQKKEIEHSLIFLKELGSDLENWVMCYPYGAYNDSLLSILKEYGCALALTTRVDIADLDHDHPFMLPRLDTNDLPKSSTSQPNLWTMKIYPILNTFS